MKTGPSLILVVLAMATISWAQVSTDPVGPNAPTQSAPATAPSSAAPPDGLASGTVLTVELSKSLDAKKTKANDKIEARTATDLLAHGRIVVPHNAKILGHVTEAKARTKDSPDSKIGITFDRMALKDGREVPLQLAVQAIARPLQVNASAEGNVSPANRQGSIAMPGRGPIGDATNSGVPSSYPGDLAPPPDPMGTPTSTAIPLSPTSKGVVGMKGLSLDTSGPAAILSSTTGNVRLDGGTQLMLRVQ
jgi:hypothetical protein